ncbi:substrate-binding domain-containing protein [Sphaerimonospora cavernae]|uniref:Substrate-binding domain-containing protein n=1 Tax=Sphaerimonospora cavernae TaxID=1740611 RepID=A0ABV6TZI8_9ACTN
MKLRGARRRHRSGALLVLLAPLAVSACTSGTEVSNAAGCDLKYSVGSDSSDKLSYADLDKVGKIDVDKGTKVAVVLKTLSNQYWSEVKRGAEAAGKIHGVEVVVQAAKDEASESEQLTIAQTMVNQDYDAYVIAPVTDVNLAPAIRSISEKCKPLIDVIEPNVKATTYVGADEISVGRQAAEFLGKNLPAGAPVLHVEGQAGSVAGENRTKGFTEGAKEAGLNLAASGVGNWDQNTAYDVTRQLMQRNPDAVGIYAANDTMALGSAKAVSGVSGEGVSVVGTDAIPAAIDRIRSGAMSATNTPFPYYQGCKAVEAALQQLSGNKVPAWLESAPTLITRDNVDTFFDDQGVVKDTGSCELPSA